MIERFSILFDQIPWLEHIVRILIYFLAAWLLSAVLVRLVPRLMKLGWLAPREHRPSLERQKTLQSLVASAVSLVVFIIATLLSLGLFLQPDTLAWMVGLFSAAFGLGARPLISDYLAGLSFIFEDTFSVDEKIELPGFSAIEGVIEKINLRTTSVRATSGELYVVPNGEIRAVRNFSRGKFSVARITLKVPSADLGETMAILETLSKEALILLPNLIEPWQILSPGGVIGQYTELTLLAKARFGKAAEMQPRLLSLIQEKMAEANIVLAD